MTPRTEAEPVSPQQWTSRLVAGASPMLETSFDNGIVVRRFVHQSYELDDMPGCRDHLLAFRMSGTVRAERKLDGAWSKTFTRRGSVTIIPAHQSSAWRITGKGELLYFFLPPEAVRLAAQGLDADGDLAITNRFGIRDAGLEDLATSFADEMQGGLAGFRLYAEAITTQLAVALVRRHSSIRAGQKMPRMGLRESAKQRLIDYIEEHLETDMALADLAEIARLSPSHLSHSFKAAFGCPPYRYVLQRKVERAKTLLETSDMSMTEIGASLGFCTPAYFSTSFKRVTGTSPRAFRASA